MKISAPCVVTLTWEIKDSMHQLIESLSEPTEYFYGGSDLLPKIETALLEHQTGDQLDLYLEPADAYGEYDSDLVFLEKRALFPDHLEVGLQFEGLPQGANSQAPKEIVYSVTDVYDELVILDGNHPLAGISLRVQIKIHDVRPATEEEQQQKSTEKSIFKLIQTPPASG